MIVILRKLVHTACASCVLGAIVASLALITGQSLHRVGVGFGLGAIISPSMMIIIHLPEDSR